jgi:hypothetical protein
MKKIITLLALVFPFITFGQSIENINPKMAVSGQSLVISITGKNSTFTVGNNSVKLYHVNTDTVFATAISVVNDTLLNALFTFKSNQKSGAYDVIVTALTLPKAFVVNYEDPIILSVTPTVAKQGETVDVTIKCANTHFTKTTNYVLLHDPVNNKGAAPSSITVLDDLTLKCKFVFSYFSGPGEFDVVVDNQVDEIMRLKKSFILNAGSHPPQIISISPNSSHVMDTLTVTIKGKNTFFCTQPSPFYSISLRNGLHLIWPESKTCISDTVFTAHFYFPYFTTAGQYEVNFDGKIILPNAFTIDKPVNLPKLVSFDPSSSTVGDSAVITLRGKNTHFLKASFQRIKLGKTDIGGLMNILNDSVLEIKTIFHYYYSLAAGKYSVAVFNDIDGYLEAADSFLLNKGNNPPQLRSISPNNALQGQMVNVIIKGDKNWLIGHYQSVVLRNAKANFGSVKLSYINDSTLSTAFNFPFRAPAGVYDVTIGDSNNTELTLPASFTINKGTLTPSLVSLSPTTGNQFETVSITVKGANTSFWYSYRPTLIASDNPNYKIEGTVTKIMDSTTLMCAFVLNSNYYPSDTFDFEIQNIFDSTLVKKNAFTINRIYTQEPKIIDIDPNEAISGRTITMHIKATPKAFKTGNNIVKLVDSTGKYSIPATTVNYINDSLISAVFELKADERTQAYSLTVANQTKLKFDYFYLKPAPFKLLSVSPCWASPMDSVTLTITGTGTHFNSLSDNIWLESKFGPKIIPLSMSATNDTVTTAKFVFKQIDLPGEYSVYLKSTVDNAVMKLKNAFTLTGSINSTSLRKVVPEKIYSYSKALITLTGVNTHFLTDADTLVLINPLTLETIYPLSMQIINDTTISAELIMGRGYFDIVVTGKQNYVLYHKLEGTSPVTVNALPKAEEALTIFPNPSDGFFTLQVSKVFEQSTVLVFDIYGKEILNLKNIESSTKIDLSEYANGLYFIKVIKDNTYKTAKIIKQ